MPRISTPSTPTTTPTSTTNLSQTVHNSSKAQPNHHLHNHYHYPLHLQNNSNHPQQQQPIHRNHSHMNGMTASSHIRNRNNISVPHKTHAINNNNYQYRTDSGISAYGRTKHRFTPGPPPDFCFHFQIYSVSNKTKNNKLSTLFPLYLSLVTVF